MNYKVQGSTEYILMIVAVILVVIVAVVFLLTNTSKPTSTQFNGQLLNITEDWSNSTVFHIGTISTSQYFLFSTTSPLPAITNDSNNLIYLVLAQGGAGNGIEDEEFYTPGGITLVSSQNGKYTYAVNDSPISYGMSENSISSPIFPAPEGLDYIELSYYNQNITILPVTSPIAMPVIQLTTSPAFSLSSLSSSYVPPSFENITYTETGLPAGSTWTSTESQYSLRNTTNVVVSSNSINEVSLNPLRDNFYYYESFPYNIVSQSVTYNGIVYDTYPDSVNLTYPQQTTYNFNYYQLSFGSFEYTLNKPLNSSVRGAIITLNNLPSNVIYSQSPFSNMVLTANTANPNENQIYALVTNYTSSSVTMDVWYNGPNTTTIYANFVNPSLSNVYSSYTAVAMPTTTTNVQTIGDTIFGSSNFILKPNVIIDYGTSENNEPNIFSSTQPDITYLAGLLGIGTDDRFNIGFNDSIKTNNFPPTNSYDNNWQTPYGGYYFSSSNNGYYNQILFVNNTLPPAYNLNKLVKMSLLNFQIAMSYNSANTIYLLINNNPLLDATTNSVNSLSFAVDDASGGSMVYAAQTSSDIYNFVATKV
ncbi:MAG: hypothetical protein QW478_10395 [Candidatus Micrarchaeaceae archaeon]